MTKEQMIAKKVKAGNSLESATATLEAIYAEFSSNVYNLSFALHYENFITARQAEKMCGI